MKKKCGRKNGAGFDESGRKRQKGFMLSEMAISMFGIIFFMTSVLMIYSRSQQNFVNQSSRADTLLATTHPLVWIVRDIKEAVQIIPGPVDIEGESYSTSGDCVLLKIPSLDANGHFIADDNIYDVIVYRREAGEGGWTLIREVQANESSTRFQNRRIIMTNLNLFSFDYFDLDGNTASLYSDTVSIGFNIGAHYPGLGQDFRESFHTQVKLRNKSIEG